MDFGFGQSTAQSDSQTDEGASQAPVQEPSSDVESISAEIHPYLEELVSRAADSLLVPQMSEYERAKAGFDYIIENTFVDEPIGLSLWRVHGGGEAAVPFIEQRALSPLRFGVGMCEDYAAALTLLLRGMGLKAEYVPGLTYSLEGHFVDHAWTMVCIDDVWYHLDCQLEDAVSVRRGAVRYRYFLKSDDTLSASHLWGQRLIDSGLLTKAQNDEIKESFLAHTCPQDYATPQTHTLKNVTEPDISALQNEAQMEIDAYEAVNGELPPLSLNDIPPVFGLEGFGPADEG